MRDKLIHQYFGTDLVWETASTILPQFRTRIAELLESVGTEDLKDKFES
jgi:uncharacterized protein with HEPN domain